MENNATAVFVTDDHKKLIFSFIHMIRSLKTSEPERIDTIIRLLGDEFDVDPAGLGGSNDSGVDLFESFRSALSSKASDLESDEKFKAFLELLTKKGYFKDAEQGTAEYESRLEKAKQKFDKRNNPYEGMSAEDIKNKGNELMGQAKYKEAIAYYSKAIELEPENHVFFANRAAAHTHLKDYRSAIIDCERAIAINPSYSKAYSRLGTSFFYQESYSRAVDAFAKACELDPSNERYKEDLKQAEEKAKLGGGGGASSLWGPGGFGGGAPGGMPDFSQVSQLMSDPQFTNSVQQMMQNPQFSQLVSNMAGRFGAPGANFGQLMGGQGGAPAVDENGDVVTPFGKVNRDALERLKAEEIENNPKFKEIIDDVQRNGFAAFQKYMGDPDVMNLMMKFQSVMMGGENASS